MGRDPPSAFDHACVTPCIFLHHGKTSPHITQRDASKPEDRRWAHMGRDRHPRRLTTCVPHRVHLTSQQVHSARPLNTHLTTHAGYIVCTQYSVQHTSAVPYVVYRSLYMYITAHTGHLMVMASVSHQMYLPTYASYPMYMLWHLHIK